MLVNIVDNVINLADLFYFITYTTYNIILYHPLGQIYKKNLHLSDDLKMVFEMPIMLLKSYCVRTTNLRRCNGSKKIIKNSSLSDIKLELFKLESSFL